MIPNLIDLLEEYSKGRSSDFIVSKYGIFTYNATWNMMKSLVDFFGFLEESSETHRLTQKETIFLVKGDGEIAHITLLLAALRMRIAFIPINRTWLRSPSLSPEIGPTVRFECEGSVIRSDNLEIDVLKMQEFSTRSYEPYTDSQRTSRNIEYLACCFPTSGTTGQPKMIAVTNYQLMKGAVFVSQALHITSHDVVAGMLSLDFDYGLNQIFASIAVKSKYICGQLSNSSLEDFEKVRKHEPTVIATMPFLVETYFPAFPKNFFPTVRMVTSSGGPLMGKHRHEIARVCPNAIIIPMYGLSEGFRATISSPEIDDKYPNSVGIPIGDTEITIRNEAGEQVPVNTIGEVWQSGGCLSWGYWNDLKSTRARFVEDPEFPNKKWLKSGDLGYLNDEGVLFIEGRITFQIKKFGLRISIDEIENQISEVTNGLVCVAVPIQTSVTESNFDVFVETSEESKSWIAGRIKSVLSAELWPRKLVCVEKIPLNIYGGKPDRQKLMVMSQSENQSDSNWFKQIAVDE